MIFFAAHTPDLFGVGLKKRPIEPPTETIDNPLLKRLFGLDLPDLRVAITEDNPGAFPQPQIADHIFQRKGIVEKLVVEVNS